MSSTCRKWTKNKEEFQLRIGPSYSCSVLSHVSIITWKKVNAPTRATPRRTDAWPLRRLDGDPLIDLMDERVNGKNQPCLKVSPSFLVTHCMALAEILVPKLRSNGDGAPPCGTL